ncbi:MAG TPA: biotin/lipoyl-containing protein [Roseiarcus sp.]|nr:biotin/lipoyl-containing protein [Roseiarcus sp.]
MQRKFRITVDGRPYEVVVEEIADAGAPTAWPASVAVASAAVAAAAAQGHAHAKPEARPGDEVAPLAGTVQAIHVTVGQAVAAGDKIATIEAMKMKTEVFAKGVGKVVAIAVKPGDSVDTGGVLVTLA